MFLRFTPPPRIPTVLNAHLKTLPEYEALTKRERKDLAKFLSYKSLEISKKLAGAEREYNLKKDGIAWGFASEAENFTNKKDKENIEKEDKTAYTQQPMVNKQVWSSRDRTELKKEEAHTPDLSALQSWSQTSRGATQKFTGLFKTITQTLSFTSAQRQQSNYRAAKLFDSVKEGWASLKEGAFSYLIGTVGLMGILGVLFERTAPRLKELQALQPPSPQAYLDSYQSFAAMLQFFSFSLLLFSFIGFCFTAFFTYQNYNAQALYYKKFMWKLGEPYINTYFNYILKNYHDYMSDPETRTFTPERLQQQLGDFDREFFEALRYDTEYKDFFLYFSSISNKPSSSNSKIPEAPEALFNAYKPSLAAMDSWAQRHEHTFLDPRNFRQLLRKRRLEALLQQTKDIVKRSHQEVQTNSNTHALDPLTNIDAQHLQSERSEVQKNQEILDNFDLGQNSALELGKEPAKYLYQK